MHSCLSAVILGATSLILTGCATPYHSPSPPSQPAIAANPNSFVIKAVHFAADADSEDEKLPFPTKVGKKANSSEAVGLPDLLALALERNPRLAQVGSTVNLARGRAIQAGLYPNPTVNVNGNEISDRTGPSGIWSVYTGQEFVTGNKLGLSQAVALKKVDQATLNLIAERYRVLTAVRQAYFEAMTLQRRAEILADFVKLAEQSVENAGKLLQAKEAAPIDVVQLEVDLERYRAELDATQRALPAAYRKLAASVGLQDMPICRLVGDLDLALPEYDLDRIRLYVLGIHPELRSAQVGVERAQLALRRATVEPIPNVTVRAGYTYQGQNRSNDWDIGVSVPVPLWNKNQGNILAAKAQVSAAVHQVGRVENDLVNRLATAFATYISSRKRSEWYRSTILPKAQKTYSLSRKAYQGGRFEYLQVLQAQRAVAEANLEFVRSLGEMWQAVSEIAGLMLEDQWPLESAAPHHKRK